METATLLTDREHRRLCWRYMRGRITFDDYWDAAYQDGDGLEAMGRAQYAALWRVMLVPAFCTVWFLAIMAAFRFGYMSSWTFDAVFCAVEFSLIAMVGAGVAFLAHHIRSRPR
jgi:hypothetical protein